MKKGSGSGVCDKIDLATLTIREIRLTLEASRSAIPVMVRSEVMRVELAADLAPAE